MIMKLIFLRICFYLSILGFVCSFFPGLIYVFTVLIDYSNASDNDFRGAILFSLGAIITYLLTNYLEKSIENEKWKQERKKTVLEMYSGSYLDFYMRKKMNEIIQHQKMIDYYQKNGLLDEDESDNKQENK